MLQSGVLLKEIDELIRGLEDGSDDGELKSRACALVFLISQFPSVGVGDTGVRATGKCHRRPARRRPGQRRSEAAQDVPRIMEELVEQGRVTKLGEEFRLQTEEGAEWTKEFNQRRAAIPSDAARMSQLRNDYLQRAVDEGVAGLKFLPGQERVGPQASAPLGRRRAVDGRRIRPGLVPGRVGRVGSQDPRDGGGRGHRKPDGVRAASSGRGRRHPRRACCVRRCGGHSHTETGTPDAGRATGETRHAVACD